MVSTFPSSRKTGCSIRRPSRNSWSSHGCSDDWSKAVRSRSAHSCPDRSWPMKTPREPQAVSWKPETLSTSWRSFWLNRATSSHECAFIRGRAACGGSGVGSSTQPKGTRSCRRLRWLPRSVCSQTFLSAGDQSSASQSLSSRCGLNGGVMRTPPLADPAARCFAAGTDSQSKSSKKR